MRFLADENFPKAVVEALRASGHDTVWMSTESPGAADQSVLEKAQSEARILLTFDKDFGEFVCRSGALSRETLEARWREGVSMLVA